MARRLGELAELVDGRVEGDPDRQIDDVRPLETAEAAHLSLLTSAKYRETARKSRAGALLVAPGGGGEDWPECHERDLLVAEAPSYALALILRELYPESRPAPGVHETALVDPEARVDETAHVGPYAVVGAGARIEAEAVVGAHVVVGRRCRVARGSRLHPHVVLYDDTRVGERSIVHSGVVLGADGFGYATRDGVHHKVPQVGRTVLGDDVEVGANAAVDRATLGETRVGDGAKIDDLVMVGHNVEVGRGSLLCGQAGIAGSTRMGDGVVLAGQAGVAGHLQVGAGVQVAAASALLRDAQDGEKLAGTPAIDLRTWRRQIVRVRRLEEMERRLAALETRLEGEEEDE